MVLVKEYRIPMPLSVEEYKIAQLYMVARFSKERTTKGEGVEIVKNEPYDDENGKGQYTHKIIHTGNNLPTWIKAILPGSMCQIEEKSWNAYPYVKTVITCPFFGDRFSISAETRYFDDDGSQENVHGLSEQALKERTVDFIDIRNEEIDPRYYKKEEDPKLYKSEKTQRGPLDADWKKTAKPMMTIYKLQSVEFRMWGLQTKVEQFLQKSIRDILLLGHKQAFCWTDDWWGLTMEDIRKLEEETKLLLEKLRGPNPEGATTTTATGTPVVTPKEAEQNKAQVDAIEEKLKNASLEDKADN